jgi:tetratricopeptide (TPR) repeat protein
MYLFPAPGPEANQRVRKERVSWTTFIIGTTVWAGMWTSTVALGNHLSLPGSQDLHHSKESGRQPLIRQLEDINNYTPPQSVSHQDVGTAPLDENPAITSIPLHPPIAAELDSAPTQPFHHATKKKPVPSGVRVRKNDAQGHANLGWKFLLNGRPQAAMAAYREALRHHPDLANAYVGMGITLKSLGNIDHAKQAIQQALELNPHLSSALVHLGYLYADGHVGHSDLQTARRLFAQASQLGDPFAGIALLDLQSRNSKF